ncbi:hypothetical protein NFI96_025927 [Prochilodus magdalenae]|nr:hypothetical protein NFI96_025927 [Prochilodus magdalenae]
MSAPRPRHEPAAAAVTGPESSGERKQGGGALKRLKPRRSQTDRRPATEEELRGLGRAITPEEVLGLRTVTRDYLCKPEDNVYNIDFTRFKIRDLETGTVLFEIAKPPHTDLDEEDEENVDVDTSAGRFVRYQFTPAFLKLRTVGATTVQYNKAPNNHLGDQVDPPTPPLQMKSTFISEREENMKLHSCFRSECFSPSFFHREKTPPHYGGLKGGALPDDLSVHLMTFTPNPKLFLSAVRQMVEHPYETRSDSFYFVDNKLIMHNKADYAYNGGQ